MPRPSKAVHKSVRELEQRLAELERERDQLRERVRSLDVALATSQEGAEMACETPDPKCECAGCSLAEERYGAAAERKVRDGE